MLSDPAATTTASAARPVPLAGGVDVLDPGRLRTVRRVLDEHALDRGLGAQLEPAMRECVRDVRVHRRLARVRGAPLETRAAARAVRVGVRGDRVELRSERPEPASTV